LLLCIPTATPHSPLVTGIAVQFTGTVGIIEASDQSSQNLTGAS